MRFVKVSDLKRGMRIGRPIFNRKGDLIFDRDIKITDADIVKIRGLNILGIFSLEPAEPLPPMSGAELEYEKKRFMEVFELKDEMQEILVHHRRHRIERIADDVISSVSGFKNRIDFPQSVRGKDEFVCTHSVNVAIIMALMCARLGVTDSEKKTGVYAALLHDIGKYTVPHELLLDESTEEVERILFNSQDVGFELIGNIFSDDKKIMDICINAHRIVRSHKFGRRPDVEKPTLLTRLLVVADEFDSMTAIDAMGDREPNSNIGALRHMRFYPEVFDVRAVEALEASIEILKPGETVLLNNNRKALVTSVGGDDVLRPTVLEIGTNQMYNLEEQKNRDIEIVDVVNKFDNRHVVDR